MSHRNVWPILVVINVSFVIIKVPATVTVVARSFSLDLLNHVAMESVCLRFFDFFFLGARSGAGAVRSSSRTVSLVKSTLAASARTVPKQRPDEGHDSAVAQASHAYEQECT